MVTKMIVKAISDIVGFVSVVLFIGAVGGYETNTIDATTLIRNVVVVMTVFLVCRIISIALEE